MKARSLRRLMIGVTLFSVVGFVIYSYTQQNEPRQGGLINEIMEPEIDYQDVIEYYPTGEVKAEGLRNGEDKEGIWVYYHINGDTLKVEQYFQGNLDRVLFEDTTSF